MTFVPSVTDAAISAALHSFLVGILPNVPASSIVKGQANRVAPPKGDFVVFTPLMRARLSTNINTYTDPLSAAALTASSPAYVQMVATEQATGVDVFGVPLSQPDPARQSTAFLSTFAPSGAAGARAVLQKTSVTIQVDVYGPNSADNVQTISTLWRDDYGCQAFATAGLAAQPLYATDPRQLAANFGEAQYEERWTTDLTLQANAVVTVAQDFFDEATVETIEVDSAQINLVS